MECPACSSPVVAFVVPEDLRECAPGDAAAAALCTRCLTLSPVEAEEVDSAPTRDPDFGAVSDAFPTGDAAVPTALLVGLLDSLVTYRGEIETLVAEIEGAGTDPFLVLDRLEREPDLDPAIDLERRHHQLRQLL